MQLCANCGEELVTIKGAAFEIKGWEMPRDAGGTNHVLWRERTGAVMCSRCVTDKKLGITADQMTLA